VLESKRDFLFVIITVFSQTEMIEKEACR